MCAQVGAARHEESDGRVETLFSGPVGRRGWFVGRVLLAVAGAAAISLTAGVFAWVGAAAAGADVSFADAVAAGANCLPAALLFLSFAALAFALLPRATVGIAYGLVLVAFVWELFGSLLDVPALTLDLSPFHHIGLVPAQPFENGGDRDDRVRSGAGDRGIAHLRAAGPDGRLTGAFKSSVGLTGICPVNHSLDPPNGLSERWRVASTGWLRGGSYCRPVSRLTK